MAVRPATARPTRAPTAEARPPAPRPPPSDGRLDLDAPPWQRFTRARTGQLLGLLAIRFGARRSRYIGRATSAAAGRLRRRTGQPQPDRRNLVARTACSDATPLAATTPRTSGRPEDHRCQRHFFSAVSGDVLWPRRLIRRSPNWSSSVRTAAPACTAIVPVTVVPGPVPCRSPGGHRARRGDRACSAVPCPRERCPGRSRRRRPRPEAQLVGFSAEREGVVHRGAAVLAFWIASIAQ
jgi:hypothetical protein